MVKNQVCYKRFTGVRTGYAKAIHAKFTDKSATTAKYKFMPITTQNKHSFTSPDQLASKQRWLVLHTKVGNI